MDSDLRVSRNTSQAEPLVWFKLKNLNYTTPYPHNFENPDHHVTSWIF